MDPNAKLASVVLHLRPGSTSAAKSIALPENAHYRIATQIGSRRSQVWIQLSLDHPPKDIANGFTFGTNAEKCDIVLSGKSISERHFAINFSSDGLLRVINKSASGTYVGNVMLQQRDESIVLEESVQIACDEDVSFLVHYPIRGPHQATYELHQEKYLGCILRYSGITTLSRDASPIVHRRRIGKYLRLDRLNSGWFGEFSLLAHERTGQLFAAKSYKRVGCGENNIKREVAILESLNHPAIVQFMECLPHGDSLYVIMEKLPCGNLGQYPDLASDFALEAIIQTTSAIEYLHARNIVHRDLNPFNVMVQCSRPMKVKVNYFGLAEEDKAFRTAARATVYYAPEILGGGSYTSSVDIWAIGMIALFLFDLIPGKEGENLCRINSKANLGLFVAAVRRITREERCVKFTSMFRLMLSENPRRRGSATECLECLQRLKAKSPLLRQALHPMVSQICRRQLTIPLTPQAEIL